MTKINQLDCFSIHFKFLYYLAIWPGESSNKKKYSIYSNLFIFVFVILYDSLVTVNFFYMPRILDNYIEELVFYFTELSSLSKVLTFYFLRNKLEKIFEKLQSDVFQPTINNEVEIINNAGKFNKKYWKIVTVVSLFSHAAHAILPIFIHLFGFDDLKLVLCSFSFIEDEVKKRYIYPIYLYQLICMHAVVWYNINIDTLFLGLLVLTIAQLKILSKKLRTLTFELNPISFGIIKDNDECVCNDRKLNTKFINSVKHFDEVAKFLALIQAVFSITLLLQFGMGSSIICICLFRFTLSGVWQYYFFLASYLFIMVIQIFVPCLLGTQITDKSFKLSQDIYNCDWPSRSHKFKNSLRIFVVRMTRPLKLTGWNIFPLSLSTFTSIINAAFSFFTLLRHLQSRG